MNTQAVADTAEVVARVGPDPVLLAVVVVVLVAVIGVVVWIVRNGEGRNRDVMEDYQSRMTKQQDDFRAELKDQRSAHEAALTRQGDLYERSLEKIVSSNEANSSKIVGQLDRIEVRLGHVERYVSGPVVTVNAQGGQA